MHECLIHGRLDDPEEESEDYGVDDGVDIDEEDEKEDRDEDGKHFPEQKNSRQYVDVDSVWNKSHVGTAQNGTKATIRSHLTTRFQVLPKSSSKFAERILI